MINIRNECFETNSSSMHSLAIWKRVKPYDDYNLSLGTLYQKDKNVFELLAYCSEDEYIFERYPYRQLTTPIEKLRYIVGYYIEYKYENGDYESEPVYYFSNKEVEEELISLIKKYTGCEIVQWYKETAEFGRRELVYPYAPATNDTGEDVMDFVKRKKISLEDLIFKPNYTIQIDGDEYTEFQDMFECGMINLDNLEDISSGVDFWNDNIVTFYIADIDNIEYRESFSEYCKSKGVVELDCTTWNPITEEKFKKARDFITQLEGKRFIRGHVSSKTDAELFDKYFQEILEEY